jgi:hypothetical protein
MIDGIDARLSTMLQSLCHGRRAPVVPVAACLSALCLSVISGAARSDPSRFDYPTHARVEYVQECIARNGGSFARLYQCSCVIDEIAQRLSYDDFVEAATFARNATLAGDAGAIFRDSQRARRLAQLYAGVEADAYSQCGIKR